MQPVRGIISSMNEIVSCNFVCVCDFFVCDYSYTVLPFPLPQNYTRALLPIYIQNFLFFLKVTLKNYPELLKD